MAGYGPRLDAVISSIDDLEKSGKGINLLSYDTDTDPSEIMGQKFVILFNYRVKVRTL